MAATQKHVALLERLIAKTAAGELPWKESANEGEYVVSFPNFSVGISFPVADVVLKIVNEQGQIIDQVDDPELGRAGMINAFDQMKDLYESARRSALGADRALDVILGELSRPKQK